MIPDELKKILEENNIKIPKEPTAGDLFNDSNKILGNLFDYFGEIFKPHEDKNNIPPFKNPYKKDDDDTTA